MRSRWSKSDDDVTISPETLAYIFPDSRLKIKGEEKKENELVFLRKLTPWKAKSIVVSSYLLFQSLWCRLIWMLTFWGNCDTTSGLDQLDKHLVNNCHVTMLLGKMGHSDNSEFSEFPLRRILSSELSFLALNTKRTTRNFSMIRGIMLGSENSKFRVIVFCTILKNSNMEFFLVNPII